MKLVTTNDTIARDLKTSLLLREGVPMGLTWGSIKAAMTILGVSDEDRVASIELGLSALGTGRLFRDDEPEGIVIREV